MNETVNLAERRRVFKRLLAMVLSLAMVFGGMVTNVEMVHADGEHTCTYENGICTNAECTQPYEKPEGDGSAGNPYQIGNAGELYYFAGIVNGDASICDGETVRQNGSAYGELTADIVVNQGKVTGGSIDVMPWTPIGNWSNSYRGTFDGKMHTISGLYCKVEGQPGEEEYVGLFGAVMGGQVQNTGIINSYFYASGSNNNGETYVGGFCGYATPMILRNCYADVIVESNGQSGGLWGSGRGSCEITNCYVTNTVSGRQSGAITSFDASSYVIRNCYYLDTMGNPMADVSTRSGVEARTVAQFASGQVAYELNGNQKEIVWGQTLAGEGVAPEDVEAMPVLGGQQVCAKSGTATCPGCKVVDGVYANGTENAITYTYPNHEFTGVVCNHCGYVNVKKPEGDGSSSNPYKIGTKEELYYFAAIVNGDESVCDGTTVTQNTEAYAELTADIVLNQGTVNGVDNSLAPWTPIGNGDSKYKGIFDGKNYTISGLYINNNYGFYQGLFGYLVGTVRNLGIENSFVKGSDEVGSVAGYAGGVVKNCYSTAIVEANSYVGGLVGNCQATIENSYFAGTCMEGESLGGGISGRENSGSYTNCYIVSGSSITADKEGVEVRTAAQFASGQVAYELNGDQTKIVWGQTLTGANSDAMPVLGGQQVYEILQKKCPGVEDTDPSIIRTGAYTNDENAIYSYDHKNHDYDHDDNGVEETYICQWCEEVKEHACEYENGYCKYCGAVDAPEGDGSEEAPYEIVNSAHLKWFAKSINDAYDADEDFPANAILVNDIYLNPEGVTAGVGEAYYWDTIGYYNSAYTFDGQGHTIYGLCYSGTDNFAFIYDNYGTVQDVTFAGVSVNLSYNSEDGEASYGTVCSDNYGVIDNVSVYGQVEIENGYGAGGICYRNFCEITDCTNYMNITSEGDDVGGISGYAQESNFENCTNYGAITSDDDNVGGIAGDSEYTTYRNCTNYGDVTSNTRYDVGGITGDSDHDSIEKGYNYGMIFAGYTAGGICGEAEDTKITQCYNVGDVSAVTNEAAGIVGYDENENTYSYCYNAGQISAGKDCGHDYAGAIVGESDFDRTTFEQCYYVTDNMKTGCGMGCYDCEEYEAILEDYEDANGIYGKSSESFASGEIAWLLNDSLGEKWLYQNLTGEAVQLLPEGTGAPVARKALFGCSEAKEPISAEYYNGEEDVTTYKYKVHNFDPDTLTCTECGKVLSHECKYGEDGYCTICHGMKVPEGKGTAGSPYKISNVAELYWFAGLVNGDKAVCKDDIKKNTAACAVLTADIVINEDILSAESTDALEWVPMGIVKQSNWEEELKSNVYKGTFDGQGYTVSGIYIPKDVQGCNGFFGIVGANGTIKNLNLDNVYMAGSKCAGGICNYLHGTVEGCSVAGVILAEEYAGGIAGGVEREALVYGCYNKAEVEAECAGGISSELYSGAIVGCYNTGEVISTNAESAVENGIAGDGGYYGGDIEGCYYVAEEATGAALTVEDFASGKAAWLMNVALKEYGLRAGYGQILTGENAQNYPVWNEETKVYGVGTAMCPGMEVENATTFSNEASKVTYTYPNHQYEDGSVHCGFCGEVKEHNCKYEYGFCEICQQSEKPEGDGTEDAPYAISNVGELFWFNDKVSGDLEADAQPDACAILTADIDITEYAESISPDAIYWTAIGASVKTGRTIAYNGTFDGLGYCITGILQEAYEPDSQFMGFFHEIGEDGVVTNLHIKESEQHFGYSDCIDNLFDEERYLGTFCSKNAGLIFGCSIETEFYANNSSCWYDMAGFCGYNSGKIVNSNVSGLVNGYNAWNYVAGFCGVNEGLIYGCANEASVDGYYEVGGICYWNQGTITNSYNVGEIYSDYEEGAGLCVYNDGTIQYCYNIGYADYAYVYENEETGILSDCIAWEDSYEYDTYGENYGIEGSLEIAAAEKFMNGYVAYALNQAQGKNVFGQTLYEEDEEGNPLVSPEAVQDCPVIGGKTVYPCGIARCPGCVGHPMFSNLLGFSNRGSKWGYENPEHMFDSDDDGEDDSTQCIYCGIAMEHTCEYTEGICELCGGFEAPRGDGSKEQPYEISNAGNLFYFAHVVEGKNMPNGTVTGDAAACAVLTKDIDLTEVAMVNWSAIGLEKGVIYQGTFDGQGHSINGLYSVENPVGAFFARTGKEAVVKNVSLEECLFYDGIAAGISIVNEGIIENCSVNGRIIAEQWTPDMSSISSMEEYQELMLMMQNMQKLYMDMQLEAGPVAGGISTVNRGTINNCWVNGLVTAEGMAGFICGENQNGSISNCYYFNNVDDQEDEYITENDMVIGKGIGNKDKKGQAMEVTTEDILSGKVAWMLDTDNSYEGNKGIWRMDKETSMPTLATQGAVSVYYLQTTKLDGTVQEYYVPAGADLSEYLGDTSWVYDGGTTTITDGSLFEETTMSSPVIVIREIGIVANPVANVVGGEYTTNQAITLTVDTEGADIYYTLDGSTPSAINGIKYTGTIMVEGVPGSSVTTVIKAVAIKDGMQNSEVVTYEYVISLPVLVEQGDVNSDTHIDANDALAVLKAVAKMTTLTEIQKQAADVNKDAYVDANDALTILKYVAHMIDSFA